MPKIILVESFWSVAIMTAYELYRYRDYWNQERCAECLGVVWGVRENDDLYAIYGTATQLVVDRDEESVIGPDPFSHALHNVWAALDATGTKYLGTFHSHPWSPEDVEYMLGDGCGDEDFYEASDEDKESIVPETLEIIVSLRPINTVDKDDLLWAQRGLTVSGRIDVAHVTFSGWYKHQNGVVKQIPVEYPHADEANKRILSRL